MTSRKNKVITRPASLPNSLSTGLPPTSLPTDSASSRSLQEKSRFQTVGVCGFCLMEIETNQLAPCEATTRHVGTLVPYGKCLAAIKAGFWSERELAHRLPDLASFGVIPFDVE